MFLVEIQVHFRKNFIYVLIVKEKKQDVVMKYMILVVVYVRNALEKLTNVLTVYNNSNNYLKLNNNNKNLNSNNKYNNKQMQQ